MRAGPAAVLRPILEVQHTILASAIETGAKEIAMLPPIPAKCEFDRDR
jgi:hypothetical protein